MAKIFKKLLSLTLTVLLIASTLVAGFSVSAAGTTTVNGNTVYDEPFDLDFSDGLKTWLGIGTADNPKFVAENGVLKVGSGFDTSWDEIGPARFKVPNVQVGDTIEFSFDLAINADLGDQTLIDRLDSGERILWPLFRQYNAAGTNIDEETLDLNKNSAGTVVSKAFTVADPDEFYRIIIRSGNALKNAWRISNITVTVYGADDSVTVYPPVEVEVDPDEPTVDPDEPTVDPDEPTVEPNPPKNLDFSNGFSYWTGETSIYSVDNGVLKTNDTYTSGSWRWLKTEKFNIPNAVAGTTVELSFSVDFEDGLTSMDGNANQQPTLESLDGYKILDTFLADVTVAEMDRYNASLDENHAQYDKVARNQVFYNEEGTVTLGPITVTDPAQEFDFWIGCGNSSKKTWGISGITITVTHPDGTVEIYPSEEEEPEVPVVEPNPPKNLDFSDGFSYWTGETAIYSVDNGVLKASDSYAAGSGSWRWLETESFNIPNAVTGTTVKLTFDVEFEDGLPSMDGNANQQPTLDSTYGYKILDVHLYQYNADGTDKDDKRKEVFYKDEGTVTLGPVTITDPAEEFEFHISCGNSSRNTWEVTNITVTATHPDGTVDTYPNQPAKPQISADTLAWLMGLILANDVEDMSADFNDDDAVNLLDVVYVKKELARIAYIETPITGPMYEARTEDVYSYNIVRYDIGGTGESVGWYFTPKEEGNYQTIILIHGQGNPGSFRDNLVYNFNKWVKAGYIEPMVVVIPEVLNSYGVTDANSSNIDDFQYYIYESQPNRFNALLTSIEDGTLSSKIDTSKKPYVAGFSMGGMAALHAGADYNTRIDKCGALSPGKAFYMGDGNWGFYNYASDIYFSDSKDALVYLSAGAAEQDFEGTTGAFVNTINTYESGIKVNNREKITKFIAPASWGGHGFQLAQMEIFMFLHKASYNRLPSNELVETVCSQPYPSVSEIPTVVYSADAEHN